MFIFNNAFENVLTAELHSCKSITFSLQPYRNITHIFYNFRVIAAASHELWNLAAEN
jgi:hypothetical protein